MRLYHLYSGNLYGGVERVLVTLARTRTEPAIEQRFGLFFEGRLARELREAGAPVDIFGPAAFSRMWRTRRARRAIGRAIAGARPDVLLAHSPWALAMCGRAAKAARIRALWLHTVPTRRLWPDRLAFRRPLDVVLANSASTARAASAFVRIDGCVHPPVPPPPPSAAADREQTRSRLGASAEEVVIFQASRIDPGKGLHVHLEALALLDDVPNWVAWFAGAPQRRREREYIERLHAFAVSAGIAERVRFLGHRSDIAELMAACDIYCQPNTSPEAFGIALVEAMAAARPVVTTTAGELAEEISGAAGLVIEPRSPAATADALRRLVLSPDLRQQFGARAVASARRLSDPSAQLHRLGEVLTRAVTSAR